MLQLDYMSQQLHRIRRPQKIASSNEKYEL